MYVNFKFIVIVADHQRVANAGKEVPQRLQVHIRVRFRDHVNGVKRKGEVFERVISEFAGRSCGALSVTGPVFRIARRNLSAERREYSLQDHHVTLAAGVDHTGFFQHGVLIHRVGEGKFTCADGFFQCGFQVGAFLHGFCGGVGSQPGNRENGAFSRFHDGLVGSLHAVVHGAGEFLGAGGVEALQPFGDSVEQKRENNAGITARPAKRGFCNTVGGSGNTVKIPFAQFGCGVVYGKPHVGAGIAVRHGENV